MAHVTWIKLDTLARDHRKKYALASALGEKDATALGYMVALWMWAADNCQDGNLNAFPAHAVAHACGYEGDGETFIHALKSAYLVDETGIIHDWYEHNGNAIMEFNARTERARSSGAERTRRWREKKRLAEQAAAGLSEPQSAATLDVTSHVTSHETSQRRAKNKNKKREEENVSPVTPVFPVTPSPVTHTTTTTTTKRARAREDERGEDGEERRGEGRLEWRREHLRRVF
jgi:hypothetical protein